MSDVAIEAMENGADLFADSVEEEPTQPVEEPTGEPIEEQTEESEPEGATPKAGIKVKYNHEERELTLEEARELAEKGLALDKTRAELETLKSAREFKILDAYAARNNMTREQYVQYLEQNEEKLAVRDAEAEVRKKYPDLSDGAAREMAEMRVREQAQKRQIEAQSKQAQAQEARQQEGVRQWEEFLREYPDLNTADKIPEGVQEAIRKGERPLSAMHKHELAKAKAEAEELRGKLQTQEKNQKNKETAVGSVTGTDGTEDYLDAFFSGFNGG